MFLSSYSMLIKGFITVWKVSKYGVFSGPYFPAFGPEKNPYLDTFYTVYISELWASELVLISCVRLSHRKDTQSVKSAWSICIQSLQPESFTPSREIMKNVKRTHTHFGRNQHHLHIFFINVLKSQTRLWYACRNMDCRLKICL